MHVLFDVGQPGLGVPGHLLAEGLHAAALSLMPLALAPALGLGVPSSILCELINQRKPVPSV